MRTRGPGCEMSGLLQSKKTGDKEPEPTGAIQISFRKEIEEQVQDGGQGSRRSRPGSQGSITAQALTLVKK